MISAAGMIGLPNSGGDRGPLLIHVNTGIRMNVMPGARMFRIVTMKLIADVVDAIPRMMSPTAQKSGPCPGRNPRPIGVLVSGVYPNQPPFGALPPMKKLE